MRKHFLTKVHILLLLKTVWFLKMRVGETKPNQYFGESHGGKVLELCH